MKSLSIILFSTILLASPPLHAAGDHGLLPGNEYPGGPRDIIRKELPDIQPDPAWLLRTGFRKGIVDHALDAELAAAPDAAVLGNGLSRLWPALLAEYREASTVVEPDDLALLHRTKPFLIIPAGGLSGLGDSEFFAAGLAEYARSGGVVLCFAQKQGADYGALPVPGGQKIEAAGWADDHGPLYRASSIQAVHPILSGAKKTTPSIETDGYLRSYPAETKVLLNRADGRAVFIVYPFGNGWVAVTTLYPELAHDQGQLDDEERDLVRDLIAWAKSSGKAQVFSPGDQAAFTFSVRGPEEGEAASIRITIKEQGGDKPRYEQLLPLSVAAGREASIPFSLKIPADLRPAMYHMEYVLLSADGRPLSPAVEAAGGWFGIRQAAAAAPPIPRTGQPLAPPEGMLTVSPALEYPEGAVRVHLNIRRAGPARTGNPELIVRAAGREKHIRLTQDETTVAIDLPRKEAGPRVAYAVHLAAGRVVAKGVLHVVAKPSEGAGLNKPWYQPGQKVIMTFSNLKSGELTVTGLGVAFNQMLNKNGSAEFSLPPAVAAGAYPLVWELFSMDGTRHTGELLVDVAGAKATITGCRVQKKADRKAFTLNLGCSLASTHPLSGTIKLLLTDPAGKALPMLETPLSLSAGTNEVPLTFSFTPEQAGLWRIDTLFSLAPPEGAGFSLEPLALSSRADYFDVGDAAVLGLAAERPMYYEPAGPVALTASVFSRAAIKAEIRLDGKRIKREKLETGGLAMMTVAAPDLGLGPHAARAVASGEQLDSAKELRFLYGARLPDLAASLKAREPEDTALSVDLLIVNNGRVDAGPANAALYDGPPGKGGVLIGTVAVPPLGPGKEHPASVVWQLAGKSGKHALHVVVDPDQSLTETNRENNSAIVSVAVPELLLRIQAGKQSFAPGEPAAYNVAITNFTKKTHSGLTLALKAFDPTGKELAAESLALPDVPSGGRTVLDRTLNVTAPQSGEYLIKAVLSSDKQIASAETRIAVRSMLLLQGTLAGTPDKAASCMPLTIPYAVKSTGTITPTTGSLKLEIKSAGLGQTVYARHLPFAFEAKSERIESVEFPRGQYTVLLTATAANPRLGASAEFVLADHPVAVAGPVELAKSFQPFPRVLVWTSADGPRLEQAVLEKLLKEALAPDVMHYKVVTTGGDFTSHARTGLYNTYLVIDPAERLESAEWLGRNVEQGRGLVLIGSAELAEALASSLGFSFGKSPEKGASITFEGDSRLGLTGAVPVSGPARSVEKNGATAAAAFGSGKAAVLLEHREKGKIIVAPLTLSRSAIAMGTTSLYSLFLRSVVSAVAPEQEVTPSPQGVRLQVSSAQGPVAARIVETLPPGARLIWAGREAGTENGELTFNLTVDAAESILYLFDPAAGSTSKPRTEVFFECNGKFVSQGKME